MLHNPHNFPIYSSFISKYSQIVDHVCPMLQSINIVMTDDEPCHLPPYLANNPLYERGCFHSPFACKPQLEHQNSIYNDIIMEVDSCYGYSIDELHALIAHEIGHFYVKYTNQILGHLPKEIEADRISCHIGLKDPLRSAIQIMLGNSTPVNAPILKERLKRL